MNSLTRIMSYDKTKSENQECNCEECVSKIKDDAFVKIKNITFVNDILTKVENYQMMCKEKEFLTILNLRYWYKDKKTKTFIWKSLFVHGDKYIYHKTVYVKSSKNVEIECKNGHCFPQTPNHHLQGSGCRKCWLEFSSKKQRMILSEFIERANKVHGEGRYDYSKVNYINNRTNVIIICHNHDVPYEFPQTPDNHLSGHGCSKCAKLLEDELRLTLEEFIERANKIHGFGRYDYSKVNYVNISTDVIIICHNHDEPYEFPQKPNSHLNGSGCPICGGTKKLTTEEFIEKANEKHGLGRYDYSKVKYIDTNTEVIIICHNHDVPYEFPQTPNCHLNGHGCSLCNKKSKGESEIRIFLKNNDILFEQEKRFEDCRNIYPLPFDFYLPQYNLCIEYDGIQHFKPIKFNYKMTKEESEKNFKSCKLRDEIKNNYCKEKGINLLRIRYDENVEEKLKEYFQKYGIIK